MTGAIVAASVLAYMAAGLFLARFAFGWMRAKSIDGNMKNYPTLYRTAEKAAAEWRSSTGDRIPAMMIAFLVLALWPAAIVLGFAGWWFGRFLDGSTRLSAAEYRDRLAARDQRIAELEREAGIR